MGERGAGGGSGGSKYSNDICFRNIYDKFDYVL